MEDYIFLIIAVVLSIIAAIKKNKKKEIVELPNVERQGRPRNYFMDQLLGEDFPEEPDEEIVPSVKEEPVLKKEPLIISPQLRTPVNYKPSFKSSLPVRTDKNIQLSVKKTVDEELEVEDDTTSEPGYLDDFSLRKAVVYSEIMNRKYS